MLKNKLIFFISNLVLIQSLFIIKIQPNIEEPIKPNEATSTIVKGAIRIANWVDDIPQFKVFFEGQETWTDENGFFTFTTDKKLKKCNLILTKRINHSINKKNTLKTIGVIPDKNFTCYSLRKFGQNNSTWLKKNKNLNHKNFVIPKNSIVILVDPKYVSNVEEWNINLSDTFVRLPRVVVKPDIDPNKLKRISAKSLLCLEDSTFHEKVGRTNNNKSEAKDKKVKITLP
jgi:hypothetical protein